MKKIASNRNYTKINIGKAAGYVSSTQSLDDPLHQAHMLSTQELGKLLESGIRDLSNLTKMDEDVQEILGIEWDDITASYVERGQGSDLPGNVDDIIDQMRALSPEDRQKILLALGDGGALDAKQSARKRRLNRLTKN